MKSRSRFAVALAIVAAPSACTLVTDLDGYSGGRVDLSPEAGTAEGGAVDVLVGPPNEAGHDSSSGGLTPEGGCPKATIALCEPFNTDEKTNGWSIVEVGAGTTGIIRQDGDVGLLTGVPSSTAAPAPLAYWQKQYSSVVSKLSLDIEFVYDKRTVNEGEFHILLQIRIDHGTSWNLIYLTVEQDHNGFALQEFVSGSGLHYTVLDVAPRFARRMHFDVAVGGKTHFVLDDVPLAEFNTDAFMQAGRPSLAIGTVLSTTPTSPISAGFKNLVFTAE